MIPQRKGSRTGTLSQPLSMRAKPCHSTPTNLDSESSRQMREREFEKWLQAKREEQCRKQELEKEEKMRRLEQSQMKKETAELSYLLWKYNKDQQKKAKELKEEKLKKEEEQKKLLKKQISQERVAQWMKSSKLKPKPVPSGLGLLSLTGSNPPSFFNPQPWVNPV